MPGARSRGWPVLAIAFLVSLFVSGVVSDDCHVPTRDIGDEAGLTADICSVNAALGRSPPDYVTAEAFYRLGYKSRDITLMQIATGTVLESGYVNRSIELFEDDAWMDGFIQNALEGKGVFTDDTKRVQMIKKLLQGGALGHRLFSNFHTAFEAAEAGDRSEAIEYVERAMANFFGIESQCSIFGNGQARGIEFGTMDEGVAAANYDFVESFADAVAAIRARPVDTSELMKAFNVIRTNFLTIYLQALSKYATLIIGDKNPLKDQAEGFAYYHVIAGQVYAESKEAHETLMTAFDLASKPDAEKAQAALDAVQDLVEAFEISPAVFGSFDKEASVAEYEAPKEVECEGINPFEGAIVKFAYSDR